MTASTIDLASPSIFHNDAFFRNPYETFSRLRAGAPMVRVNFWGGLHYIGGYQDICDAATDPRLSHDLSKFWATQFKPEQNAQLTEFSRLFGLWLAHYDGPKHTRLRSILTRALSQAVELKQGVIRTVIEREVAALPLGREFDLIRQFAYPLPARVIAALLEIADDKFELFMACADLLVEMTGSTRADFELAMKAQASIVALSAYLQQLIDARRAHPGDDLISLMLSAAAGENDAMTDEEIQGQCTMMLFAGHETTRNLIGNSLFLLLSHPKTLAQLRRDPTLVRRALEEVLRVECPVQLTVRSVLEDFDLLGVPVRAGEFVMFNYASANRDERKFQNPDRFDIHRNEQRSLAFAVGPHTCLGARLSLLEGQLALAGLLNRFARVDLLDPIPNWHHNAGFRGLRQLRVIGRGP